VVGGVSERSRQAESPRKEKAPCRTETEQDRREEGRELGEERTSPVVAKGEAGGEAGGSRKTRQRTRTTPLARTRAAAGGEARDVEDSVRSDSLGKSQIGGIQPCQDSIEQAHWAAVR
jgi:hypothetical protein